MGKASDVGTLQQLHKCRGEKKALEAIIQEMKGMGCQGGKIRIAHCFNEPGALMLKSMICNAFHHVEATVIPFTGLCCFYAERGSVMVGLEG